VERVLLKYMYTQPVKEVQEYEAPEVNFFDMNTTSETPIQSFTKLIHHLKNIDKI
jgi:hypothetical protein